MDLKYKSRCKSNFGRLDVRINQDDSCLTDFSAINFGYNNNVVLTGLSNSHIPDDWVGGGGGPGGSKKIFFLLY